VYILDLLLPVYFLWVVGLGFWTFMFSLTLAIVLALPVFALVMFVFSRTTPDSTPLDQSHFTIVDSEWKALYAGKKIPIDTLHDGYIAGKVDFNGDLLQALHKRYEFSSMVISIEHIKFFCLQFIPELLTHSKKQDFEQVTDHYDRGNDFYNAFLGPMMIYTSAIFKSEEETLEEAQMNKLNGIFDKIHLQRGDKLLDIGCGWGTLVGEAAVSRGVDATGITISKEQVKWAHEKFEEKKVKDRARLLCMDYRDIPAGKYDKITCLEMSEHVGVRRYSAFLQQIQSLLKDDGVFYLQIAGLRRAWQYEDLLWGLFMGKYVFPGADASCPLAWVINQLEAAGFEIQSEETIGIHYSATLLKWYENWLSNKSKIMKAYGPQWFRKWEWFLAWSVISAGQGSASCYQIVCHKNTRSFDRRRFVAGGKLYDTKKSE
jgi:cyclopropane fatty-acyl-phospholipid synthase-like methyltransferase